MSLSWTAPPDGGSPITGYRIRRSTGSGTASLLAQLSGSRTRYRDVTARPGITYMYTVRAVNAIGYGARSTPLTITAR